MLSTKENFDYNKPYAGIFDDREFEKYLREIFKALDASVIDPARILVQLFTLYVESANAVLTWERYSLFFVPYENFLMINKLKDDFLEMKYSTEIFAAVVRTEFVPERRLNHLFNAFYSMYPNYYHELTNNSFKQKIRIKKINSIIIKNISALEIEVFFSRSHLVTQSEIDLFRSAGILESHMPKLLSVNYADVAEKELIYEHYLLLSEYATQQHVDDYIAPFLVDHLALRLNEKNHHDFYDLFLFIIKKFDVPILKTVFFEKKINHGMQKDEIHLICEVLAVYAQKADSDEIRNTILPILLSLFKNDSYTVHGSAFSNIAAIIEAVPVEILENEISKAFVNELAKRFTKITHYDWIRCCLSEFYFSLVRHKDKAHLQPALQQVENVLQNQFTNSFSLYDQPNPMNNLMEDFYELATLVYFATQEILVRRIIPILCHGTNSTNLINIQTAHFTLTKIASFPDTRLAPEYKKLIFDHLMKFRHRIPHQIQRIFYKSLTMYVPFHLNAEGALQALFKLIFDQVKNEVLPLDKKSDARIPLLTAIIKVLPQKYIEPHFASDLISGLNFSCVDGSSEQCFDLLNAVLDRFDYQYLKNHILQDLINRDYFLITSRLTDIIMHVISRSSFNERIFWTRFFLKSFKVDHVESLETAKILVAINLQNEAELESISKSKLEEKVPEHQFVLP